MSIFRRSSSKNQVVKPETTAGTDFPEIVSAKDPIFAAQHNELDALEERLQSLQASKLPPIEDRPTSSGRIAPSAGRVNEVDLRQVINLDVDDDDDADFERRFNAFANHSDVGGPNWMD